MKPNLSSQPERLQSLDTLRGCDMFFIMGGSSLLASICGLFPNSEVATSIAAQFYHVSWHGFAFQDMIFPLFLFIAGISFPYSIAKSRSKQYPESKILFNVVRRGVLLILLGMIYNGLFKFDFENLRCASVLGRIGLAWMIAALIFMQTKTRSRIVICAAILIGYWLLLAFVPAPDGNGDPFSKEGSLVGYVDRHLMPGRLLYDKLHDPEGLLSALPAIVTALLGMLTGEFIKTDKGAISPAKKALWLAVAGVVFICIGKLWDMVFPINKNLWSSSFVCFVGGLSMLAFAFFYFIVDVKNWRKWTIVFRVIGMNSITIYLAQRMINFSYTAKFFFGGAIGLISDESWQTVFTNLSYVLVCWFFVYFLYRQRIFLKV